MAQKLLINAIKGSFKGPEKPFSTANTRNTVLLQHIIEETPAAIAIMSTKMQNYLGLISIDASSPTGKVHIAL